MKKFLLLSLLCMAQVLTYAQNQKLIDSLQAELSHLPKDTNRVDYLNALAFEYRSTNLDTAFLLVDEAVALAEKLNYKRGLALAYNHYGILYKNKQNYTESVNWHQKSLAIKMELKDFTGMASSYNNLGRTYGMANDEVRSIYYYLQSLRIREKENDVFGMGAAYNNISHAYLRKNELRKALAFGLEGMRYMRLSGDSFELAKIYGHVGYLYYELNQYQTALSYLKLGLSRFDEAGATQEQCELLVTSGNILLETHHEKEGLAYLLKAKQMAEEQHIDLSLPSVYLSLGQLYGKLKQKKEAIQYTQLGLQKSKELNMLEAQKDAYEVLSVIYDEAGDYKNALTQFRLFETYKDSIIQDNNTRIVEEMQTQYQTEKKDAELKQTSLELSNVVLANQRKQLLILILLGVLVLGGSVLYLGYTRFKLKQKALLDATLLQQLEIRNKAIVEAEEKERLRIARELHDGVGQQLSAAKMNMSAFEPNIHELSVDTQTSYQNLISLVDDAVKEIRSISHNMMPNALIRSGLVSAVRDFVNKLSATGSLKVDLQIVGLNDRLTDTTESVLYRVLQECVSNIIKHAQASVISIQLIKHESYLNLMIEDNGKGFNASNLDAFEGIGLKNILSRIQYLNGTVELDSTIGRGTTIVINVPL